MSRPTAPVFFCLTLAGFALLGFATPAQAHPGHGVASFLTGFQHPWLGLDHVLAIVTVGLLAARMGSRRVWVLPVTFVGMMALGGLIGLLGGSHGLIVSEWGITGSVLAFALAAAVLKNVPILTRTLLVSLFALCHGHAHVVEMANASAWGYFPGMLVGTAGLIAVGLGLGLVLKRTLGQWSIRTTGALVAATFALTLTLQWIGS